MRMRTGGVVGMLFPPREARRRSPHWWLGIYFVCCLGPLSAGAFVLLIGLAISQRAGLYPLASPAHWALLVDALRIEVGGVLLIAGSFTAVLIGWAVLLAMMRSTLEAFRASLKQISFVLLS